MVTIKNNILMSIHCQGYFVIFSVFWVYDSIKKCAILKTMQKSTIREEKKMKGLFQKDIYNLIQQGKNCIRCIAKADRWN